MSESSGSESVVDRKRPSSRLLDSPAVSLDSSGSRLVPPTSSPNNKQSASHRFVGTVDVRRACFLARNDFSELTSFY